MPCVAVDLFCGIGGLTKGLTLAGIQVAAGYDIDNTCAFTYEANNDAIFINEDVANIEAQGVLDMYPEGCVKALVGCAPCQPFSRYSIRYRKDGHKDEKWRLLYSFERLVEECEPEIVSMENVPSLANEKVFSDFVNTLRQRNYYVEWRIAYCPEYGVPQNRKKISSVSIQIGRNQFNSANVYER